MKESPPQPATTPVASPKISPAASSWLYRVGAMVGLVMVAAVFYFSWIPDPAITRLGWIPKPIARWADVNGNLRTGAAMLPLGLLLGGWLIANRRRRLDSLLAFLSMAALVALAETGQLLLPTRVFDWRDIALGSLGSLAGMIAAWMGSLFLRWLRVRISRSKKPPSKEP